MSESIQVTVSGEIRIIPKGTTLLQLSKDYAHLRSHPIILATVDNDIQELFKPAQDGSHIEFLDITDANGFRVYQRTASFLLIYAAKQVLGKKTRIVIEHSINKNYYCELPDENIEVTDELLEKISNCMKETVANDLPIEKHSLPLEVGIALAKEFGLWDKVSILKYRRTANANFYKLDWFYDYFYGQMAPSTGYITHFKLKKRSKGFFLQFPAASAAYEITEIKPPVKIMQVFEESSAWAKILKVDTVGSLNDRICSGELGEIVRVSEALHEKKIANIADMVTSQSKNIVLIAGPSSSGKTTFARRLAIQLRVNGLRPHIISLDNYFVDRALTPRDADGKYNFEALEAIDVRLINENLSKLLQGETVEIPSFDFLSGRREYKGNFLTLNHGDVLILEGIHGLNEEVTSHVPKANKFKIFISALTQLNLDDHNRIPTTDTRLIRRMVRDYKYRGADTLATISMWPSVLRGEVENIFPYQEEADAFFNSALIYEMCVLKQFAEYMLFSVDRSHIQHVETKRLIKFLDCFLGVSSEEVPRNSILREFIGGSCFHS